MDIQVVNPKSGISRYTPPSPPPDFFMVEIPHEKWKATQASALFRDHLLQFFDLRKKVDTHTLNSIIIQVQVTPHPLYIYSLNSRGHYRTPTQTRHY